MIEVISIEWERQLVIWSCGEMWPNQAFGLDLVVCVSCLLALLKESALGVCFFCPLPTLGLHFGCLGKVSKSF